MDGGVKSAAIPANSSAPMSGVEPLLTSPSKSSVIPATEAAPLSSCVAILVEICRKLLFPHVVLRKVGPVTRSSLIDDASLDATLAL